ncbi:hypothetical protein HOLleu_33429 [Holothuria leucospilota]|uniref:Uncharacterized protein n=1 Tax=Holothuria leucospilota TaxID=206669 RepID=A0A9Q0YNN0_HOLLE|nr:hypothetical protein HOLleu_33429 [Holothuria leucospilota]
MSDKRCSNNAKWINVKLQSTKVTQWKISVGSHGSPPKYARGPQLSKSSPGAYFDFVDLGVFIISTSNQVQSHQEELEEGRMRVIPPACSAISYTVA